MNIRISVIVPVFNGARTLGKAIDSILAQTYPAYEIIIVDDGSTDDTKAVVTRYGDPVRYIHQENAGVSAARNHGGRVANGDWLTFLDADDWYYPDRLRWHAEWIEEDHELDFLTGEEAYVRPDGTPIGQSMPQVPVGRYLLQQADGNPRIIMDANRIGEFVAAGFGDMGTLTIRKTALIDLGGFPTEFKVCEDKHFVVRLCAQSRRVGVVCLPMAAYCIHEASATRSNQLQAQQQTVMALTSLRPALKNASKSIRHGWRQALYSARLDTAASYLRSGDRQKAIQTILPALLEQPSWQSLKGCLSVIKGLRKTAA